MDTQIREDILDTLNRLLDEKSPSKITISDVAERCGVSRQTIYYHFSNLDELLEAGLERRQDLFLKKIKRCANVKKILTEMILVTRNQSAMVTNCINDRENVKFDKQVHHINVEILKEIADKKYFSGLSKAEYERMFDFYAYAISGMMRDLRMENEDAEKVAEQLFEIMRYGFKFRTDLLTKN